MALKMYKNDIDTYISTFENLASEAGYNRDAKGTIHLFAQGLQPNLLCTLLYLPAIPQTMDDWQRTACDEVKNNTFRETMLNPHKHHYKWQYQQNTNGRHQQRHHRNCYNPPTNFSFLPSSGPPSTQPTVPLPQPISTAPAPAPPAQPTSSSQPAPLAFNPFVTLLSPIFLFFGLPPFVTSSP